MHAVTGETAKGVVHARAAAAPLLHRGARTVCSV
jgi:hypothetical protein